MKVDPKTSALVGAVAVALSAFGTAGAKWLEADAERKRAETALMVAAQEKEAKLEALNEFGEYIVQMMKQGCQP